VRHPLRLAAALLIATGALVGLTPSPAAAAPLQGANRFENAPLVQTVGGTFTGNTFSATKQFGERVHAGNAGGASVWFRWRAVNNGPVRFSTRGSDFDTLLAVYRGNALGSLVQVRANDDVASGDRTSRVQFQAQAGVTYRIVIDGYNRNELDPPPAERGNYVLRVLNYAQA
jgi:hypothetical protein